MSNQLDWNIKTYVYRLFCIGIFCIKMNKTLLPVICNCLFHSTHTQFASLYFVFLLIMQLDLFKLIFFVQITSNLLSAQLPVIHLWWQNGQNRPTQPTATKIETQAIIRIFPGCIALPRKVPSWCKQTFCSEFIAAYTVSSTWVALKVPQFPEEGQKDIMY